MHGASRDGPAGVDRPHRPDSLRLELLTIPEDSVVSNTVSIGARGLERIDLEFSGVSYVAAEGVFSRKTKTILENISGQFLAGDLTAIMGPSGAGKSSLMNILAGYTSHGVAGALYHNGLERRSPSTPTKVSNMTASATARCCYIMQDDRLQPLLTVQEAMFVAAELKMASGHVTPIDRGDRVKAILKAIGLYNNRKTRTASLSGGQKKRLSIALELIRNPPVLFFDEPTSGLDSSASRQIVSLLKKLSQEGRTVVCTIHQPSATIFEMFDHLYALSDGRCVYQGSVKGLVPYLQEVGLPCPPYHNPADYLLEVARGDYGNDVNVLVTKSENGLNEDWRRNYHNRAAITARDDGLQLQSSPMSPTRLDCFGWTGTKIGASQGMGEGSGGGMASCATQLKVLLRRACKILSRDRQLAYTRIITHLMIALVIGTLYYGIGRDARYALDNFNFLFFSLMFIMFTAFSSTIVAYAEELPIVIREHFNRWYSIRCYFIAVTLADLPVQLFATSLYVTITYHMTHQPNDGHRFWLFFGMCVLVGLVAQSLGALVGAAMTLNQAVIVGPLIIMPFVVFSGFFVHLNDAHPYMRWLFSTSFLRYGFQGMVHSVFGYNRAKLTCSDDYCHFSNPQMLIDTVGMRDAVIAHDASVLAILLVALKVCTYVALWVRVSTKR